MVFFCEEFVPFLLVLLRVVCSFWVFLEEFGSFWSSFEEFVPFGLFGGVCFPSWFWSLVFWGVCFLLGSFGWVVFGFFLFGLLLRSLFLLVFWKSLVALWSFWGVCSFWSFGKSLVLLVFCVWVCSRTFFCFLYITWAATIGRDEIDTIEAKVINILFIFFI